MYKFADRQLDITNDIGYSRLSKIMKQASYRDELKGLDVLEANDLELLDDGDFALIHVDKNNNVTRRFPYPDMDNAIVSAMYLVDTYKNMDPEEAGMAASNLSKKLDAHSGISSYSREAIYDLDDKLRDIIYKCPVSENREGNIFRESEKNDKSFFEEGLNENAAEEKSARAKLPDSDFVFVSKQGSVKNRLFPIRNVEELEKQAEYFDRNYAQFSLEHRNTFAKKLRDRAAEYMVTLPGKVITKYASFEWCPTAYECIKNRIDQLKQYDIVYNEKTAEYEAHTKCDEYCAKALVGYIKLAEHIGSMNIDDYAHTLHMLDKASGLDKGYGKYIRDPYASTYKYAAEIGNLLGSGADLASQTTKFMDNLISSNDIRALDISQLGGLIDQFTFNELQADPIAVFNSLPIPYKSVILDAIQAMH